MFILYYYFLNVFLLCFLAWSIEYHGSVTYYISHILDPFCVLTHTFAYIISQYWFGRYPPCSWPEIISDTTSFGEYLCFEEVYVIF